MIGNEEKIKMIEMAVKLLADNPTLRSFLKYLLDEFDKGHVVRVRGFISDISKHVSPNIIITQYKLKWFPDIFK